jgi:hypothetical protein
MIASRDRIASGTSFRTPCATTSSSWHLNEPALRAGVALHRQPELFCVMLLPPAEGARDEGRQSLRHAMA